MRSKRPQISEADFRVAQRRFLKATHKLMDIVEGARNERWQNERGFRLKDTPEWCAFYVAFCAVDFGKEAK